MHPNNHPMQWRRWGGVLLLIAITLLYVLTLDNGLRPDELTGGDLITHQYAQVEARPSNAPGYPLYTMGGWLWFRLGRLLLGWMLNPFQILSAYSMIWGLASLAVLYFILLDVFDDWLPAALLTAFHATTFFFWYYSVTTEQYTSAVFQTLLIMWLAFRWDEKPHDGLLLAMAFVSGTMLANMVTTLFIMPPLLWFIFSKQTPHGLMVWSYLKRPLLILKAVAVTALPLLSYLYIYIRGAQHPEWRGEGTWPTAWAWFVDFITIQQGRDELAPGLDVQFIFTDEFPALMGYELTWLVFFGGLIGLAFLGRRRAILLYSTLIIYMIFCWGYRFGNWFQVIIPAYPIFTIGFAAGLQKLIAFSHQRSATSSRWPSFMIHTSSLIILLLSALLVYRFTTNIARANQRNLATDTGLDPGWAILADAPDPPALISGSFEEKVALEYLDKVWNVAPEMVVTDPGQLEPPIADMGIVFNRYLTRRAIDIAPDSVQLDAMTPQAAGLELIALPDNPPHQLPTTARQLDRPFGEALQLAGWERVEGPLWQMALYWQTSTPLDYDYTISVRPLVAGQMIVAGEEALIQDHEPVWGVYPTSHWPSGIIIRDVYALSLPDGVEPDAVQIVVYRADGDGFENLAEQVIPLIQSAE
ncbi:MAG: DUF2723 domain-containing protein [Anaerolineae bacterium]|nr:DUF2723 domain-containing protein [Anaerolineae bacterium]